MASGWWDNGGAISGCVAAYQPIGASSLAASYTNKANPGTYDAAPGTAPTFAAATGWTFNGTTQYLRTFYSPPNQAAFSAIVRFSGALTTGTRTLLATPNTTVSTNLGIFQALFPAPYYVNNAGTGGLAAVSGGVLAIATNQGYKDGATDGTTFVGAGAAWKEMYIAAYNGSSVGYYFSGVVQAIAIYNTTLTAGEVATLTTAMNALTNVTSTPAMLHAAQRAAFA